MSGLWRGAGGLWGGAAGLYDGASGLWSGGSGLEGAGSGPPPTVVPVNVSLPLIFGTAQSGQTLVATNGTWTQSPNSYTFQWKSGGTNIAGATSQTFLLTPTQVGTAITVTVIATNIIGASLPATSAPTAAVIVAAPVFSVQPSISPTSGLAGATFTATDGTANNTTTYTRRWLLNGTSIGTGTTVAPPSAGSLVLEVTATGPGGSTIATSTAATVSPVPAPVFSVQPSISPSSGTATVTLFTATDGTANNTTSYAHRWLLNSVSIGTGPTVTPSSAGSLVLEVTATGAGGSTIASSAAVTVAAAPSVTVYVLFNHGDSRIGSVYACTPPTQDNRAMQFVTSNAVANGYTTLTTPGLVTVTTPYENPVNNQGTGNCVPFHYAVAQLLTDYFTGNPNIRIVTVSNGYNGASVAFTGGHTLGPLPDGVTAGGIAKTQNALTAIATAFPGALIKPVITVVANTNDASHAVDPALLLTKNSALYPDLRTAFSGAGFSGSSVPVVVVSLCPEYNTVVGTTSYDRAQYNAAMTVANVRWCQLPIGVGSQHEGEVTGHTGGDEKYGIELAGRSHYGRSIAIALGLLTPAAAVLTVTDNAPVSEGTNDAIPLSADKRVYWTVHTGYSGVVAVSDPMVSDIQSVLPAGGTWPAYTGTSADTITYMLDGRDADGLTFTITRHVVVTQTVVIPYIAADNFDNRTVTTPANNGWGVTSGINGYGGGVTWTINSLRLGKVESGKGYLWTDGINNGPTATVPMGTAQQTVEGIVTVAGSTHNPRLAACYDGTTGYGVVFEAIGTFGFINASGYRSFGTFAQLADGSHTIRIDVDTNADQARLMINGAVIVDWKKTVFDDDLATGGTTAGFGIEFQNTSINFDNFKAWALGTRLSPLSFSSPLWVTGSASSGTIIGAAAGSTIVASGLPAGLTINSAARTWAWTGTGTAGSPVITLTEYLALSPDNGRASVINGLIWQSGSGWTPASTTTLGWWDAMDTATITKDGSNNVTAWADKSGNARTATGSGPLYGATSGPNSHPGITTNAGNLVPASAPAGAIALIAVVRPTNIGGGGGYRGVTSASAASIFSNVADTAWGTYASGNKLANSALVANTNYILIMQGGAFYKNGVTDGTYSATDGQSPHLGGLFSATQQFLGALSEIIWAPTALTASERLVYEGYVGHKWGITLPSGHPFETVAP